MSNPIEQYITESTARYHYGAFAKAPQKLDYARLATPIATASAALAGYDRLLQSLPNSALLLGPLRKQEAVISSRMEGTISTVQEILWLEADSGDGEIETNREVRHEAMEVLLYSRALNHAQRAMQKGYPISEALIRELHKDLLSFGRGVTKSPGNYKATQNYIGGVPKHISFVPIAPEQLAPAMGDLVNFINKADIVPIVATALAHVEFEALHPFDDGNGRVGRMLITLMLWQKRLICEPHFYISGALEEARDEYIETMRRVSLDGDWTAWVEFFLAALEKQAQRNMQTAQNIIDLYEMMKPKFREALSSKWATAAQDFIFANPIFRNRQLIQQSGIPPQTAMRFTRALNENGILHETRSHSGRRPRLYAFRDVLELVK